MLVLPLIVLPFILAFTWAGQGLDKNNGATKQRLSTALPEPQLEQRTLGKMELYRKEAKAASHRKELMRMDPYLKDRASDSEKVSGPLLPLSDGGHLGEREGDLLDKLEQLDQQLQQSSPGAQLERKGQPAANGPARAPGLSNDVRQLEALMDRMQPTGPDPELQQLEGMLDKILDVQHPERVESRHREKQMERPRFKVLTENERKVESMDKLTLPDMEDGSIERNAFYGLEEQSPMEHAVKAAIAAEVAEETTFEREGRVKIKLLEEVRVNGMAYPKGSLVYGEAALDGSRVKLVVTSLRSGKYILPVELEAHDQDAMPGIPISGSLGQEIQQGAGDALVNGMPNMASGMTLETQMASAGVSAAKGLFRKKNKAIKITLKAGHPILLINTQNA